MTNQARLEEIATAATLVAGEGEDLSTIRVAPEHVEPFVRAEMPGATAGEGESVVRDVMRALEKRSSMEPVKNSGEYLFVEVDRPYEFPSDSKILRDRTARLLGYAVANCLADLPEEAVLLIREEAAKGKSVMEAFNGNPPVQLNIMVDDFLA